MTFSHAVTFNIGEPVYRKADGDQCIGFIVGITFRPCGVVYLVSDAHGGEDMHYDFELSREKVVTT